ncbi:MAG: prenyltransferase/squalene oxidase repeat-containing protein [Anaerolineae bacterium]
MKSLTKRKIGDLCNLIATLGYQGGGMSASVYDTAQTLRFCPPEEGTEPALEWLADQQVADGGWGRGVRSHTRDIPTIAAILAFAAYPEFSKSKEIIDRGLKFLREHHHNWESIVPEDLPVGMELILPKLLSDAKQFDLEIPQSHYQNLIPIYHKKINYIRTMPLGAGSPPTFSWEAWGEAPDTKWIHPEGGVAHSPSATAYWAYLAKDDLNLQKERDLALEYLENASNATGLGIPGVLPTAWPITRFEQSYVLHILLMADLLDHPELAENVQIKIDELAEGVRPNGVGFTDVFNTDGDDTAATAAVFCATGRPVNPAMLEYFSFENHYLTYPGELQASHTVTARMLHGLRHLGFGTISAERFLLSHQLPSGSWPADKWNVSQYHGTCLAVFALKDNCEMHRARLIEAAEFLVDAQLEDGGWGALGVPNMTDTAYALVSLYLLINAGLVSSDAFVKGQTWLDSQYEMNGLGLDLFWLNKQEYSALKVDQAFQLAAMLAVPQHVSIGAV